MLATSSYRFGTEETARDGVRRIARGQLEMTIDLLRDAHGHDERGESVHEARKALKRLRALVRLTHGRLDDRRLQRENLVLRDVGRALSGTRDAQVLLETLDALRERYADGLRQGTWSGLRESLAATAAQPPASKDNGGSSLLDVLSEARERVSTWPLPQDDGPSLLAGGFADVYRRGRRAFRAARRQPTPEALHELRKRAKDLWHAAQLLRSVSAEEMSALGRDAHRLSDLLGEDHDLTILQEHASRESQRLTAVELELVVALASHRQRALRLEAMECASGLYREKPKRLLPRLSLT